MSHMSELDAKVQQEPPRCKMCGDVLENTELNDHDIERGVCNSCYSAEVNAGECFEE